MERKRSASRASAPSFEAYQQSQAQSRRNSEDNSARNPMKSTGQTFNKNEKSKDPPAKVPSAKPKEAQESDRAKVKPQSCSQNILSGTE